MQSDYDLAQGHGRKTGAVAAQGALVGSPTRVWGFLVFWGWTPFGCKGCPLPCGSPLTRVTLVAELKGPVGGPSERPDFFVMESTAGTGSGSQGGQEGGNNNFCSLLPSFDPATDNVKEYIDKVKFLEQVVPSKD